MEPLLIFMVLVGTVLVLYWGIVMMVRYLGWRKYYVAHGTDYWFNEGFVTGVGFPFYFPLWLEWKLRWTERLWAEE